MGTKRPAEGADLVRQRPRRETVKRTKISPPADENSSDPSSCSVSVDSALQSSPPVSEHTRQSSLSSVRPASHQSDSEDNISSSISGDGSDSPEEEIITIGGPKKPDISQSRFKNGADDLRARLNNLLPQLAEANKILSDGRESYTMEDVEEDEQHIEMNLGLGVLEEQNGDEECATSGSSSESEDEGSENEDGLSSSGLTRRSHGGRKTDAMSDLLGNPIDQRTTRIEDLG